MESVLRMGRSAYQFLLHGYPRELRIRYGVEMERVFQDQLEGEWRLRGAAGAARVALGAGWELMTVAAPLHLRNPTVIAVAVSFVTSSIVVLTFFRAVSPGFCK